MTVNSGSAPRKKTLDTVPQANGERAVLRSWRPLSFLFGLFNYHHHMLSKPAVRGKVSPQYWETKAGKNQTKTRCFTSYAASTLVHELRLARALEPHSFLAHGPGFVTVFPSHIHGHKS
jgi:hypothetical protein